MKKIPEKDIDFYVGSLQRGERQGFNYFFKELHSPLTYFAFRFLNEGGAAGEVTDMAFIQLWYRRTIFHQYNDIKFWLYTYVRNDCINRMSRALNERRDIRQQKNSYPVPPPNDSSLAEVMAEVYGTIASLPADHRIVFEMLFIQGKTISAIARELNLTVDTIRVRQARGIRSLQKKFETI
ncbi:MAG: sigma-70 family RNA polymerase sigma factor [Bacteroidota bacterium]|nr:sigma-70 family RNA polymerase sigma factor [Bacteroidota bacterium]